MMRLGMLTGADEQAEVTGFAIDNRKVTTGTVFGAFQGARFNGEDFIEDAIKAGAVAIVARLEARVVGAVHLAADEPRALFAQLAARFYAPFPQVAVAVTGTNGKTSTVELTRQLWQMAGHKAASIGTLGITTADSQVTTGLTTPDIVTFLDNMASLARAGVTHAAFEASSHGLAQYRTEGLPVIAGAFSNLSRDHLDYHGTMEDYFAAKMRLFSDVLQPGAAAVIWADDAYAQQVEAIARARGLTIFTVGEKGAFLQLVRRSPTPLGQTLMIAVEGRDVTVDLPLIGGYQAANALLSAGLVIASGGDIARTLADLEQVQGVRGRLECAVMTKAGAPVYVDYAHTPDGLAAAIEALRPHTKGRLITVFGAGGDRDTGKRPQMGATAARLSEVVIVTDDNPRSEDPALIRRSILTAAPGAQEIGDRRSAIAAAIAMAQTDDVVLIAGKGHEQGQIVGNQILPFDDVQVAQECAA